MEIKKFFIITGALICIGGVSFLNILGLNLGWGIPVLPPFQLVDNSYVKLRGSSWEIGSSSDRIAKGWFSDVDITGGILGTTPTGSADIKSLVNKEYVDLAVTSLGATYYMHDEDDATGYKTCYLNPSSDAETYIEKSGLADDDYIGGWISASGEEPAKLLKGVYDWYITLEKTTGTKDLRVYWKLVERKSDNSEVVIATSSNSNEIDGKATYLVPLQLDEDYLPEAGSRIVGKLYADVSGGGSAPTVRVYYQGNTSSRWEIPANTEVLTNIFVPYEGAKKNVDLGSKNLTTTGGINASEVYNSGGDLKIMPDIQGDMTLFQDTAVASGSTDGKKLRIYRIGEKNTSGDIYIDQYDRLVIAKTDDDIVFKPSSTGKLQFFNSRFYEDGGSNQIFDSLNDNLKIGWSRNDINNQTINFFGSNANGEETYLQFSGYTSKTANFQDTNIITTGTLTVGETTITGDASGYTLKLTQGADGDHGIHLFDTAGNDELKIYMNNDDAYISADNRMFFTAWGPRLDFYSAGDFTMRAGDDITCDIGGATTSQFFAVRDNNQNNLFMVDGTGASTWYGNADFQSYNITTTGKGSFGNNYTATLGDDNNTQAGYFTDGSGNDVYLADGSYSVFTYGDIYGSSDLGIAGKITSWGGYDPPYILLDKLTKDELLDRIKFEVPIDKYGGLALWWNGNKLFGLTSQDGKNLDVYEIQMNKIATYQLPDKFNVSYETEYYFDTMTGKVKQTQKAKAEKYKIKEGIRFDRKTGKFYDKEGQEVLKEEAIELIK